MDHPLYEKIHSSKRFQDMVARRERFAWFLSAIMLVIYFAFILIIAFSPATFGKPISEGSVVTWGIPVGLGVIISAFVLTGIYVRKSNREFDAENSAIIEEAKK
ncbi:DUF485 domain-containing protein [Gallaecimonas pentaromativorans]|uniref:Uncharacterized membrane protein (DUF485 family) n=1 Tax=Gallaecimonas pentaromativorans TaxID=584787 RepID=A0A3N1PJY2_9GAMM|nr:DUF485 domain-containing protein [Gallaecimonas pentaromativorans]MED5525449.1 DUF485 domain-containing protein [Pseudomonadota bacterium]ROQ27501.1 uncharacterized membrane protein (DUF485 family) [Gallaecimonas pentaromativorans]